MLLKKTVRRLALLLTVPAIMLGGLTVASSPAEAAVSVTTLQSEILRFTNYQRSKHGCRPVRVDSRLVRAARGHSAYMARTGRFSHTGSGGSTFATRVRRAGYSRPLSENIAWGYTTGRSVVAAWLRSPGHRRNMLNCSARYVGIGAVYASNGRPYYTQDFGR